jgi:hypothetical protein
VAVYRLACAIWRALGINAAKHKARTNPPATTMAENLAKI